MNRKTVNPRANADKAAGMLRWQRKQEAKRRQHEASDTDVEGMGPLASFLKRRKGEPCNQN